MDQILDDYMMSYVVDHYLNLILCLVIRPHTNHDVIEAHGHSMRYKLTIVSIHAALKVNW